MTNVDHRKREKCPLNHSTTIACVRSSSYHHSFHIYEGVMIVIYTSRKRGGMNEIRQMSLIVAYQYSTFQRDSKCIDDMHTYNMGMYETEFSIQNSVIYP